MTNTPELLNQAYTSYRSGRVDEAESLLRQVVSDKNDPQAAHALAGLLLETGRPQEALPFAQSAVRHAATNPAVHFQLAQCLAATGDLQSAIEAIQRLVRLDPRNPEVYLHLGIMYQRTGDLDKAKDAYHQALHCNPDFIPALNNLSALHRERGQLGDAASLADRVLRLDSHNANALNNLGIVHVERNAMRLARECFQRALDVESHNPEYLHNLGLCDAAEGKFSKARERFEQALTQAPTRTDFLRDLCQVTPPAEQNQLIPRLEKYQASATSMPDENRGDVYFALAAAYASNGRYEEAFDLYREANDARRSRWKKTDIENERKNLAALKRQFTSDFINSNRHIGTASNTPVFILGMPRSGTTLIDQILSSHVDVSSAGELTLFEDVTRSVLGGQPGSDRLPRLDKLNSQTIAEIGNAYLHGIAELGHEHTQRVTDKQLINFRYLGLIVLALPNAKIIHCRRDPRDTCLSCYFTDFQQWHYYANDLVALGEFYNIYREQMTHWEAVLSDRFITVDYESLVNDFDVQAKRLVSFCDLEWDERCLNYYATDTPAKTASYFQVRQKPHSKAIGRYRHYETQLKPLFDQLGL
ncbi:MAG: sulfotransferase [Gammaproteobacteria bacterium]